MADITDVATDWEIREREASIANRVVYSGDSAQDCEECGDGISSARQLAVPGCQLCTSCATDSEQRARFRR